MKKSSRNKTSRSSRSGGADLGPYASATFYSDLNYSNPYTFPPAAVTQRSFI